MKYKLAALAVSKMEAPFFREWVEFHRIIGVEHFYIHDAMVDDSRAALQPYIDMGVVELFEEKRHPCQWEVYEEHFTGPRGEESEWLCVMDLDEFFVPKTFDNLQDWLTNFKDNVAAVGVAWTCFGSNGHVERPEGLVIENYLKTVNYDEGHHRWIKSIVRPTLIDKPVVDPHYFHPKKGYRFVNPLGNPIHTSEFEHNYPISDIQVNHYVHKSRQDWNRKYKRGSPDIYGTMESRQRKLEAFDINEPNCNKVIDDCALRFLPELKRRLALLNAL